MPLQVRLVASNLITLEPLVQMCGCRIVVVFPAQGHLLRVDFGTLIVMLLLLRVLM